MTYEYTVTDSHMVTPTTLVVTMFTKRPQRFMPYKPGQYAAINFVFDGQPTPVRCFSLISSPHDPGWLQFAMRVKGNFTQAAARKVKPGDVVQVEGPFGGFVMNPYRDRMTVLLAGGIGVTPFMSMVRTAAAGQAFSEMLLVYSCQSQDDVPFADELMALGSTNPYLHVAFVISKGPVNRFSGWPVFQGRVSGAVLDTLLGGMYSGKTFFLCGPQPFMNSMTTALKTRRVAKRMIITEVFSQKVPQSGLLLGNPFQVYALTALSLMVGTGIVFNQDLQAAKAKAIGKLPSAGATTGSTNTRQDEVDQTINGLLLQDNNDSSASEDTSASAGQANDGTSKVSPPDNSSAPNSSSNRSSTSSSIAKQPSSTSTAGKTPSPTPSTSPTTKAPSPAPTPSPTTTPTVKPAPAPAPLPTPPPAPPGAPPVAPAFRFTASATSITKGSAATLSWGLTNSATAPVTCSASGGWSGIKATSGTQSVTPTATTTYTMVCSNSAGSANNAVTINVVNPPPPPPPPPPPKPTPPPPPPPPSSGGS